MRKSKSVGKPIISKPSESQVEQLKSNINLNQSMLNAEQPSLIQSANILSQLHQPEDNLIQKNVTQDQERLKFVKNMQRQRRLIQKRKKQKLQEENQKLQNLLQLQKQEKINKIIKRKQQKKESINQYLQKMKEEKLKREAQAQISDKLIKSLKSQKTLQNKMEDKFFQFQNKLLQEQKAMLAKRRQVFFKPMQKQQFQQHLSKIQQLKGMHKSRSLQKQSSPQKNYNIKFYKSQWYKKVLQQQICHQKEQKNKQTLKQLKQLKDRQQKYSDYIRVNLKPQVDSKKAIIIVKNKIKKPKRQNILKKGLQNLQFAKQHKIKITSQQKQIKQKSIMNPQNIAEKKQQKKVKAKNYLDILKKQRSQSLALTLKMSDSQNYIQNIKNSKNLTKEQKICKIMEYAQKLQLSAKRMEQLVKNDMSKTLNHRKNTQDLINIVSYKLSLLNKL